MAGVKRMDNIHQLWKRVLKERVPGDFVETGVWRGGSSIFSRAVLHAYGINDRTVHLVDSFAGLPPATTAEDSDTWSRMNYIAVSQDQVKAGFERYGLLDEQVKFHKGFFRYSMPAFRATHPGPIAILRMDGDMFESTMDVLFNAYDLVAINGYVIVDDWRISVCRKAILKFFEIHNTNEDIMRIDKAAAYWQKTQAFPLSQQWYSDFNESRGQELQAGE